MPKLIRFGLVGSLGFVVNLAVYYAASELARLGVNISSVCAFCVAVANNYALNHTWTFKAETCSEPINPRQFARYLIGNIHGLVTNLVVLNLVILIAGRDFSLLGQTLGILFGMVFNFLYAKKFVFSKRTSAPLFEGGSLAEE